MDLRLQTAFVLGLMAAERVHGVSRRGNQILTDAVFTILRQVANGELTLLDTPEETIAGLPPPPPELAAIGSEAVRAAQEAAARQVREQTHQAMRNQRQMAAELLRSMGQ